MMSCKVLETWEQSKLKTCQRKEIIMIKLKFMKLRQNNTKDPWIRVDSKEINKGLIQFKTNLTKEEKTGINALGMKKAKSK